MEMVISKDEQGNRKKGMAVSIIVHLAILILLIIPFIGFPVPPPGQQGILVSLGLPDQGQGDDMPDTQDEKPEEKQNEAAAPPEEIEKEEEVRKRTVEQPVKRAEVITQEDPAAIALRIEKEKQAAAEKARIEQERLEEERKLAEARKKAAEEAAKKAAYEQSKKQYSDLLAGAGKGNTGTPGNQGDPNGDPNASKLEGISTGSGMVGGGLGERGVLNQPKIEDSSQKRGRVVVDVCVDQTGRVISANYTQRGSRTTDSDLRALAERSSRQFLFTSSEVEKQCGTITIDFKLK